MKTQKIYNTTDAEGFKQLIDHLLPRLKKLYKPQDLAIIRIKNWFDHKWLNYSGKKLKSMT